MGQVRTAALLAMAAPVIAFAQSAAITMDGRFEDWTPDLTTFVDNNAPATGIDLLSMQVTNDESYLYIKLVTATELDLQDDLVPHGICLFIDGDNNASTGNVPQSSYGAEVRVRFDTRTVTEYFGASSNVGWSTLDLVPLPTTTGTTFEISIARNAKPDGVNDLITSKTIRILFTDLDNNDRMPNTGAPAFTYTFDATPVTPIPLVDLARLSASDVRVTTWNVLSDGITNTSKQPAFHRIITAISPDVIGLVECVNTTAAQVKTLFDAWMPIGGSGWHTVKDDFDEIVVSRWPILQTWPALDRQFPVLIDLPSSYATDLLLDVTHLQCCTADATRQLQCDAWAQFILDAKSPGGTVTLPANTPFVIAGDMNAVGWAQQMNTLITGNILNTGAYGAGAALDWDNTDLTDRICPQTDGRMAYTWRSNTSAYPSGRLDYMIHSDAAMTADLSFTLRTDNMSSTRLAQFGLQVNDNTTASDHLPITTDYAVPLAGVNVAAKVLLEGPYDTTTGLMYDSLRVRGLVPFSEPYSGAGFVQAGGGGGETTTANVLTTVGNNAIVDWVLLELRDKNNAASIIATKAALVQRDGDVVASDGVSALRFSVVPDNYFIAIRHRDHLGVMTAASIALNNAIAVIDFTSAATSAYGTQAEKSIGAVQVLWAGNAVQDHALKYTGTGNDRDPVLTRIGGSLPTATLSGYFPEDLNLDGVVKYTGAGNDRDVILVNVGSSLPTNVRQEQLP
jgi:endonuclease/exonuclease/phosphatase family metal-dependent hydrolase